MRDAGLSDFVTSNRLLVITGAAGFMGEHALRFALANYSAVIATDLEDIHHPLVAMSGMRSFSVVQANLTDTVSLEGLAETIRNYLRKYQEAELYIWHMGGVFSYAAPESLVEVVNVNGTRNMVNVVALPFLENLKAFVYWSGATVYGEFDYNLPVTEEHVPKPSNVYGWSKYRAEQVLMEAHRRDGLPVIIMRPTGVYGPGGPVNKRYGMSSLFKLFDDGRLPNIFVGKRDRRATLIHVEDVIRCADFLGSCEEARGEAYIVTDDRPYLAVDVSKFLGEELGNPFIGAFNMPPALFKYLMAIVARDAKRYGVTPDIDPGLGDMILLNAWASNDKLVKLATAKNRGRGSGNYILSYPDGLVGLKQTIDAFRKEGWIL